MTDDSLDNNKQQTPDSPQNGEKKDSSKKSLMGSLNPELKQALSSALGSWDTLSEQVVHKKSPEQERLSELKQILGELKLKIDQFD
jgi:hypothetical protein